MGRESLEASLLQEMRRGTIVLCVLSHLDRPMYGYGLAARLSEEGVAVDQNTLYPLLRRLSSQGLLASEWDMSESKPRKYYRITKKGQELRKNLAEEWRNMSAAMARMIERH